MQGEPTYPTLPYTTLPYPKCGFGARIRTGRQLGPEVDGALAGRQVLCAEPRERRQRVNQRLPAARQV